MTAPNTKILVSLTAHSVKSLTAGLALLIGAVGSTSALASPPADAQTQARALLSGQPSHNAAIGARASGGSPLDVQAQARAILVGAYAPSESVTASAQVDTSREADAQQQARDLLLSSSRTIQTHGNPQRLAHANR